MNVMDKFSMKGKVSIITGAAQGLGQAMAEALASAGSDIVIAEINTELAVETAKEIAKTYGVKAEAFQCNVTSPEDDCKLVEHTVATYGKLDVMINNAGIVKHIPAEDVAPEDWLAVINVNLNGVFFGAQAAGRVMIRQGYGNIINTASMSGIIVNTPQPQTSYNSSKAGVIQLTKSLACEWAPHNIRVNAICPGYMQTEMTKKIFADGGEWVDTWMAMSPMKRPGTPDELQGVVLYLASDASTFTTGTAISVDGAYTAW